MASKEFPELWQFFINNLVPGKGEGYKKTYLESRFQGMIDDLIDADCKKDDDIHLILKSYLLLPELATEFDDMNDVIFGALGVKYNEEFKDLYETHILPLKSDESNDEDESDNEVETEDEQSD